MDHYLSTRKPIAASTTSDGRRQTSAPGNDAQLVSILSVSSRASDHLALERMLRQGQWTVHPVRTVPSALTVLAKKQLPIVICESEVAGVSWKEMLEQLKFLEASPSLLVTSRLADEQLWVEALNLGAYDVVSKPFNSTELTRVLDSAWRDWRDRHKGAAEQTVLLATG